MIEDANECRRALEMAARDIHYLTERVASARPQPEPADNVVVAFGSQVTILRDDDRRQTFRIVGEDQADPGDGSIAYVSPLPVGSSEGASVRPWRWAGARLRLSRSNRKGFRCEAAAETWSMAENGERPDSLFGPIETKIC
jgi:hypothetical protein